MIKKVAYIVPILLLASIILFVSMLRTATIKYEFNGQITNNKVASETNKIDISYNLAYPGKILPNHPLWQLKAVRDRVWLTVTSDPSRKAEVNLLFADKRIGMSMILFEENEPEIAYSTLLKAEQYLKIASDQEKKNREDGLQTSDFARTLVYSSLKHRQLLKEMMLIAPEDAKPKIIELENYSIDVYNESMYALHETGIECPENPFDGE